MTLMTSPGYTIINDWLAKKGLQPFEFQQQTWQQIIGGNSGLVNAPTGYGKTFSVFLGAVIQFINDHPDNYKKASKNGLQLLWITPLRALAKDIARAMDEVIIELNLSWKTAIRNGDTPLSERQKQKRNMPEILIITPESLHLFLAQKGYPDIFKTLKIIAVDEWHELIGSKRGVLVELAISRIINSRFSATGKKCQLWGISATIGNLELAKDVLLAPLSLKIADNGIIIRANLSAKTEIISILPDEIEKYPWAGHLGLKLAEKIIPIIEESKTTLLFINTRGMSERWYQTLLAMAPQLAGAIALHHGSIEHELRIWVEEALHVQKLKVVVCTASLDLGVDFRPVDTVIQVGSPKGVGRFLQRAGRSNHRPGECSKIYFVPTHSLELAEAAALKQAIEEDLIESRDPMTLCFDVLIQFLGTLAIGEGFLPEKIYDEIKSTYCFADISPEEWNEVLHFITTGGNALAQYDEYKKIEIEAGVYRIKSHRIAMRHRLHIGTIVSDPMLKVKFMSGGYIGVIEEGFISRLEPGNSFVLAGRNLELVAIKEMTVIVKKSNSKSSIVPSWQGGRMPLSANLGRMLRETFDRAVELVESGDLLTNNKKNRVSIKRFAIELQTLFPLFQLQQKLSCIPRSNEFLIEQIETKDGFHLFAYPFEGRQVHEAMAALLAYRISRIMPISFSLAMNDYGFELLSDQPIPVDDSNVHELFTIDNLIADIQKSVNSVEMSKRKFRDIAVIGGLIFQGYPGEHKKARHLQSSASLLFKVFSEYDPDNLLIRQSYQEVFDQQMEEVRLRNALQRIRESHIMLKFPIKLTPFCFPIKVDSMRENLTSEKLEDQIRRMQQQLE